MAMAHRKFWGWGNDDFQFPVGYLEKYIPTVERLFGLEKGDILPLPRLEDISISDPLIRLPADIAKYCTDDKYDRLSHTYGKAFRDISRGLNGQWSNPPDFVAFPKSEADIKGLLSYASDHNIAIIPYGGGSSVCGGIEAPRGNGHAGAISVDMRYFDKLIDVDRESRSALLQAGMYGPDIEKALRPHKYSLRHYPQSFEFSTLGGWIATRSGGHFATLYTHIDEFVQSVRMITPSGVMETRKLPSHGAGPSEERFVCGSEGSLGIITRAWMRVQDIPIFKAKQTLYFKTFESGVEACRLISHSGLYPSNARLVDAMEAFSNGLGDGSHAVLLLGFESHHHEMDHWMKSAVDIALGCGATKPEHINQSTENSASQNWKTSFLLAPYLRDELVRRGLIVETFETAITWDRFSVFHKEIISAAQVIMKEMTGGGIITTRFTHLYTDGPAVYYTIMTKGRKGKEVEQWDAIKDAVSMKIIELGGPITHHHAVGKDHKPYYQNQRSTLFGRVLRAAKNEMDPAGIMNPETLI